MIKIGIIQIQSNKIIQTATLKTNQNLDCYRICIDDETFYIN
jgi:hypothetical protein